MWWVWRWLLNGADPRIHREGKVTQPPDLDAASGSLNVYSYFYLFLSLLKNQPKSYWKRQHMLPSHVTLRPLIQFFRIFPSEFYRLFWVRFRIPSESFKRLDCFKCCYNVSKQGRETLHLYHINFRWPQSIYKWSILLVWRSSRELAVSLPYLWPFSLTQPHLTTVSIDASFSVSSCLEYLQ